MKVQVEFSEIRKFIKVKTKRDVQFSAINERTVSIETNLSIKMPIIGEVSRNIQIQLSVDKVVGTDIYLNYESGLAIDMIIKALFVFFSDQQFKSIIENSQKNSLVVHLSGIKEASKVFEYIELKDICFQMDGVVVEGGLK